jgi:hypothetical protein
MQLIKQHLSCQYGTVLVNDSIYMFYEKVAWFSNSDRQKNGFC